MTIHASDFEFIVNRFKDSVQKICEYETKHEIDETCHITSLLVVYNGLCCSLLKSNSICQVNLERA